VLKQVTGDTHANVQAACSLVLSATSQQYFSLGTNQPPAISQQYFSLRINEQAEVKGERMRTIEANYNAHTNLKVGLRKLVYEEN
jgi:hypothetical protein